MTQFTTLVSFCSLALLASGAHAGVGSLAVGYAVGKSSSGSDASESASKITSSGACFATLRTAKSVVLVNLASLSAVEWGSGTLIFKSGAKFKDPPASLKDSSAGFKDPSITDQAAFEGRVPCLSGSTPTLITVSLGGKKVSFEPASIDYIASVADAEARDQNVRQIMVGASVDVQVPIDRSQLRARAKAQAQLTAKTDPESSRSVVMSDLSEQASLEMTAITAKMEQAGFMWKPKPAAVVVAEPKVEKSRVAR